MDFPARPHELIVGDLAPAVDGADLDGADRPIKPGRLQVKEDYVGRHFGLQAQLEDLKIIQPTKIVEDM